MAPRGGLRVRRRHRHAGGPLLLLALVALPACQSRDAPTALPVPARHGGPVVEVRTARVRRGAISQPVAAPGSLVARRESQIGAEVQGRIVRIHVSEGDRVEAGQALFEIDPETYRVRLSQAEAGLELAGAERRQIAADLSRARALRQQDVMAEQEIERLRTQLAVAEARERQAREALALARRSLDQTVVRAPYAGSIAERLADEGTTANLQPQTIVLVLQETGELEAQAAIPESQLALVRLGDRALVHVEGLPEPVKTRVTAVSDTIDPATRTYLVKMRVPNRAHRLKAGVFAHLDIFPRPKTGTLLVPRESVRSEDGRTRVLLVRDGRAMAVPIEVGLVSEAVAEVLRGLDEGDVVVAGESAGIIAPGMRVRVAVPAEAAS